MVRHKAGQKPNKGVPTYSDMRAFAYCVGSVVEMKARDGSGRKLLLSSSGCNPEDERHSGVHLFELTLIDPSDASKDKVVARYNAACARNCSSCGDHGKQSYGSACLRALAEDVREETGLEPDAPPEGHKGFMFA